MYKSLHYIFFQFEYLNTDIKQSNISILISNDLIKDMEHLKYFKILAEGIHSVVIATTDKNGLPSTRVIDIMLYDDEGLYFLTAKGKVFYEQLMNRSYVSLSGMTAGDKTMVKKAISISGAVCNIGAKKRDEIFEKNSYMAAIYPSPESRVALEVFCLYKGRGEYFDLSTKPITRDSFSFGGQKLKQFGYYINDVCNACGLCLANCPQDCIDEGLLFKIRQENCLHCGNCFDVCPSDAVIKVG